MKIRKIKDIVGAILTFLAVIFIVGLLLIPLSYFGIYANKLFGLFLIIIPIYILFELYYFVKDTPKRKSSKTKEKSRNKMIITAIEWTLFVIFIILILLAREGVIFKKQCPEAIQGNPEAGLKIKYFSNPFCPSCWKQEIILKDTLDKYGDFLLLERYDYRYCKKEWNQYGLKTVPGFSIEQDNKTEIFGSMLDEKLNEEVCKKISCEKR